MPKIPGEFQVIEQPLTYTVRQAAELLHTNVSGINRLINSGYIRALEPRGTRLIYRKTLIEFIEKWEGYNLSDPSNPIKLNNSNDAS